MIINSTLSFLSKIGLTKFFNLENAFRDWSPKPGPENLVTGAGLGLMSRKAFSKLKNLVYTVLDKNENVELVIKS